MRACVYTQVLGTPTASQHNIFDSEKLTNFSCIPDRIRTSVHWISSLALYQLSHLVTPSHTISKIILHFTDTP